MTFRHRPVARRPAFTLLEVMLATAIGVLLMYALYVAFNVQLRHVDVGREVVEESALARALLARMANDVTASLPPLVPPKAAKGSGSSTSQDSQGTGSPAGSTAGTGSQTASSTQGSSAGTGSQGSSGSGTQLGGLTGPVQFNLGVQGDETRLVLFISRVPRELDAASTTQGAAPPISDLRRVSYWLSPLGLARQEIKLATSDEALNTAPEPPGDEAPFIIAEEVKSLEFRYFDGTSWETSWNGATQSGSSGSALGPPVAVEIKLGIAPMAQMKVPQPAPGADLPEPTLKYYRHVVAIPTANGTNTNPQ
jgi:hypothetical protein